MSEVIDKFRSKFPAYQNVPERELGLQIGRKFPQYLADPDFKDEFERFERGERLREEQAALSLEEDPSAVKEFGRIMGDVGGLIVQSAGNVLADAPEAIAITAEALERKFPTFGPEQSEEMLTAKLARGIRSGAAKLAGDIDLELAESFMLGKLPQGIGSMLGFMGGGIAGKAAKVPQALGVASLGAASGGVNAFKRAKIAGADDDMAFQSFAANAMLGTSEALPISRILSRINRASGNALKNALLSGTEEALQEAFQSIGGDVIAKAFTPEDVKLASGLLEDGAAGGLTGFLTSALIEIGGRRFKANVPQGLSQTDTPNTEAALAQQGPELAEAVTEQAPEAEVTTEDPTSPVEQVTAFAEQPVALNPLVTFEEGVVAQAAMESAAEVQQELALIPESEAEVEVKPEPASLEGLGIKRPAKRDISLEQLSESEFDKEFRQGTKALDKLEQQLDETDIDSLTQDLVRKLGAAQDRYTAVRIERHRRNVRNVVPPDLLRELVDFARGSLSGFSKKSESLKSTEEFAKAQNVVQELARQKPVKNQVFRDYLEDLSPNITQDPDWQEVMGGTLKDVKAIMEAAQVANQEEFRSFGISGITTAKPVKKFLDKFIKTKEGDPPPVNLDTSTIAPDFQPYDIAQQVATRPNGFGRIKGLGWIFDPRAKNHTPTERAIITRASEVNIGQGISTILGMELQGKIDGAFQREGSKIVNVAAEPGAPLHISDFFEQVQRDPSVYDFTPEQQEAVDETLRILGEIQGLQERNEISPQTIDSESFDGDGEILPTEEEQKEYFPRIRVFTKEELEEFQSTPVQGRGVGSKPFFQKSRLFESEEQGAEKGVTYEPSIEKRLVTLLERSYRRIADKRLADNPELGGETMKEREQKYLAQFELDIQEGVISREKVLEIARSLRPDESFASQPAFRGKVYPKHITEALNKAYGQTLSDISKMGAFANQTVKGIQLGIDFAAPFLQGQVLFFSNPALWTKATIKHLDAFRSEEGMKAYARNPNNQRAMRELAQLNVRLGSLPDFMAGLEEGKFLTRLPGVGGVFERFGRSFQTFTDYAMVEMWKAQREVTPMEQWPIVAETLQSLLHRSRMTEIGVTPNRALRESLIFLAPSYIRGGINLVAAIGQSGVSGKVARKSLASWAMGSVFLTVAGGLAQGLTWEEIFDRLNWDSPDFLMIPVKFGDGRVRNFGFGGIVRSLMRLGGEISGSILRGDGKVKSLGMDNPVLRWTRGKLAPVPGLMSDAWLGRDFLGNDITFAEALRARVTPLALQTLWPRPGEPPVTLGDVAPSILGLAVWPENQQKTMMRERDKLARERGYPGYEEAPFSVQAQVTREVFKRPEFATKPPVSATQIERAFKATVERIERITEGLSEENRERLSELSLRVTGYDRTIHLGKGLDVPLTQNQSERYEELIIQEYDSVLGKLPWDRLGLYEPSDRQDLLNKILGSAKQTARAKLLREMAGPVSGR